MKRNETILVYSVTALLVVILAIAIIFGNDGRKESEQKDLAKRPVSNLEELMGVKSARPEVARDSQTPGGQPQVAPPAQNSGVAGNSVQPSAQPENAATTPASSGATPALAQNTSLQGGAGGVAPTADPGAPVVAVPLDADAARRALGVRVLGESRRDRDYRIVKVKQDDSLSVLVQRWTGSTDALNLVAALNETLDSTRLRAGQEVIVPWVEDDVVLARYEASRVSRREAPTTSEAAPQKGTSSRVGTAPLVAKTSAPTVQLPTVGKEHLVVSGDSLWKIAGKHVDAKLVPAYIEKIVAANPGLNPARLPLGKKIVLP